MKVLTVGTEYAFAIVYGIKAIEYRSWKPGNGVEYPYKILIHSNKEYSHKIHLGDEGLALSDENFDRAMQLIDEKRKDISDENQIVQGILRYLNDIYIYYKGDYFNTDDPSKIKALMKTHGVALQPNCILGSVEIASIEGCVGDYEWILRNPVFFNKSVKNVKGHLRLWEYSDIVDETPCDFGELIYKE